MRQDFPVLLPSSWLQYALDNGGQLALGGHKLHSTAWQHMFKEFWSKFEPSMPGVDLGLRDRSFLIPLAVHGDEGRGKAKRPIMVLAVQPIISWQGPEIVNTSGTMRNNQNFLIYDLVNPMLRKF